MEMEISMSVCPLNIISLMTSVLYDKQVPITYLSQDCTQIYQSLLDSLWSNLF